MSAAAPTIGTAQVMPAEGAGRRGLPARDGVVHVWRHPGVQMTAVLVAGAVLLGAAATQGVLPAIAVLLGVAGSLVVLERPWIGGIALAAAVPVVAGLNRGIPVPGLRLSEILIGWLCAIVLLSADRRVVPRWRAFDWVAFLYALVTLGFGLWDLHQRGGGVNSTQLGTLLGPLQFFLLYRAIVSSLSTPALVRRGLWWLLGGGVFAAFIALLQYAGVGPVISTLNRISGGDNFEDAAAGGVSRVTGPFSHAQPASAYFFLIVCIAAAVCLSERNDVRRRSATWIVLAIGAAALMATFTMGPILSVLVAIALVAFWRRKLRVVSLWFIVAVLGATLLFSGPITGRLDQQFQRDPSASGSVLVPQTVSYRYGIWTEQYFPALRGRLVTGYGPDIPPEITWRFTESLYITLLLRGGIPLLLLYLGFVIALGGEAVRTMRETEGVPRAAAQGLLAALILLMPMQVIQAYFIQAGPGHLVWALGALVIASRNAHNRAADVAADA
ncbi:O-antigen ligase family protein [Conexibacter woesei]|uniref:O-antigen ligase family protein n=1 Tax=Conexibacter woesei TaxID=191495 RepID=UPI0003FEE8C5|nr:O-antigen ligase family protein [Conexibacter woesei]